MAAIRSNYDKDAVERQALLIDMVPVQMWFLSDAVTYGSVNQCHADFIGKAKPEIESRKLYDLFPDDVAAACEQSNRAVLESKQKVVSEEWVTDSHGARHLLEITKTPVFDGSGKVMYIACFAIDITFRHETEMIEQQRKARKSAVLGVLNALGKSSAAGLNGAIDQSLELLGEAEGADRCYIFLFDQDTASNTHEWCAPGIEPQKQNLQNTPFSDMSWWLNRMMAGHDINLACIADLPAEASREREILEAQSIQSLLAVPISKGESIIGFLGFDAVRTSRSWDDNAVLLIRVASEGLAHAIARQRAETALITSEANYRRFLETMADLVVVADQEGRILFSNTATSARLGYSPDMLRLMHIRDMHPPWFRKEAEAVVADMLAGRKDSCPLPLITRDGALVPVETRVSMGMWSGKPCILGISKDLGKEQEALQKFERFFGMNPALMAVSMLPERRFVDVNSAFLRTLGYSKDEVVGKTSGEIGLFVNTDQQKQIAATLKEYGRIQEVEMQVKTKDGAILDGLFSGELIESQGKKYFLTVMIDITERKRAENERERFVRELRQALAEVKTLRGIVPICSNCKRIRDDRGYWEQVESYVTKHTEAAFSHGICPECMKKLYPEFCKDEDVDTTKK